MPDIYWLIAAQRQFQEAMLPATTANAYADDFTKICERLAGTFPRAKAVIVRDRLRGYRNYSDRHILLVEVIHRTKSISVTSASPSGDDGSQGGDARAPCTIIWPEFC